MGWNSRAPKIKAAFWVLVNLKLWSGRQATDNHRTTCTLVSSNRGTKSRHDCMKNTNEQSQKVHSSKIIKRQFLGFDIFCFVKQGSEKKITVDLKNKKCDTCGIIREPNRPERFPSFFFVLYILPTCITLGDPLIPNL